MDPYSIPHCPSPRDGYRDVDGSAARLEEIPQLAGAAMAQRAALSAREGRGLPKAAVAQARVADGIHAAMDPVQAPHPASADDCALVHARPVQLEARDNSVLAGGDPGDARLWADGLFSHTENKSSGPVNAPVGRARRGSRLRASPG